MNNSIPRPEYPRPDFERKTWLNLNGEWQFCFDDNDLGEKENWYRVRNLPMKIIVPYCYQSKLSGIHDQGMHEILWYKKEFELPDGFKNQRVLLNFGAVDYYAKVWVNGEMAGEHRGGHVPFKIDITKFVREDSNDITLRVEDRYECAQPRGKQYWKETLDRCWYTPTSGIWQTVWLETTGKISIDRIHFTPDIDRSNVLAQIYLDGWSENVFARIKVSYKGELVKEIETGISGRYSQITIDVKEQDEIDELHYWTPETPNLYDVEIELEKEAEVLDCVYSYFGMRKISVKDDCIYLNNKPYYQRLVLDQGYWPDSLMTPPTDEDIVFDIEMTKKMGFNGARKHQKIEDPRYYYWADKLGLLVWGELPSAYEFSAEEIENLTREFIEFINRDYNHPCIITWVPLNESWGVRNIISNKKQQSLGRTLYHLAKAMDGTRLVSTNDGWEQVESDICAIHDYTASGEDFKSNYVNKENALRLGAKFRLPYVYGVKYEGQPFMITEYGGIAFESDSGGIKWGYNGAVKDEEAFLYRYGNITRAIQELNYCRGYCYTQLTDVMQEVNGLMTADRQIKVNAEQIKKINISGRNI